MNTPLQPDRRTEVLALSKQLIELLGATTSNHGRCIDALLLAYASLAIDHPCCTHSAAEAALRTIAYLSAAAGAVPAGTPVH